MRVLLLATAFAMAGRRKPWDVGYTGSTLPRLSGILKSGMSVSIFLAFTEPQPAVVPLS